MRLGKIPSQFIYKSWLFQKLRTKAEVTDSVEKYSNETVLVNNYEKYCRSELVRLLKSINLDVVYERAEGNNLWMKQQGELIEVLDLVGGFGANIFGHYHPDLVAEAQRLFKEKVPILAQGSCRSGAARLAKALCDKLGDYIVIFTNSGTETVEAAIKHAYLERQRPIFWAVKGAFHGKTLGSIQLTWSYKEPFEHFGPYVRFLDPSDPEDLEIAKEESDKVSAIFIEPILGEGGIKELPIQFINWVNQTCKEAGIPIIVDEIQTGMGRTGSFLASQFIGLEPDYLCLSKALGGGISKIGALLVKRNRFVPAFGIKHTSTFAEDDFSCLIALKALEILERDNLTLACKVLGERLLTNLEALKARYPKQIKEVRGKGLMVGVELQDQSESPSNTLRMVSKQGYLVYMAAAYLLHVHRIRVAPTLSQPFTLRIEPSAYISEADLERFCYALSCFCEAVACCDIKHLTGFQIGLPVSELANYSSPRPFKREAPLGTKRVAFMGHLIVPEDAANWDPSLQAFQPTDLEAYLGKTSEIFGPTIYDRVNIRSQTGDETHLSFIGFNLTSRQIEQAWRQRNSNWIMEKIEAAVALAKSEGCQVVGFGGYTSIISRNCRRVQTSGIALTSGNSLTVGMGILAMKEAANKLGIEMKKSALAIVGATGNIASTYAIMMAPYVKEVILIVRNLDSPSILPVIDKIKCVAPEVMLHVTDSMDALSRCSLVLTASNVVEPLIYPEHLNLEPMVICDISVPSDVAEVVKIERPNALLIQGGIVRLPHNDDLVISGIPLPKGHVFACMAETLLMGLEGITSHGSYGAVTPQGVEKTLLMAQKHGFTLGQFKNQKSY